MFIDTNMYERKCGKPVCLIFYVCNYKCFLNAFLFITICILSLLTYQVSRNRWYIIRSFTLASFLILWNNAPLRRLEVPAVSNENRSSQTMSSKTVLFMCSLNLLYSLIFIVNELYIHTVYVHIFLLVYIRYVFKIQKSSLIIHWDFRMKIDMEFKGGGVERRNILFITWFVPLLTS